MEICGIEVVAERQRLVEVGVLTLAFIERVRAQIDDRGHDGEIAEPEEVTRSN